MFDRPHHLCLVLLGGIVLCLSFLMVGPQGMAPLLAVAGALALLVVGWALYRQSLYRLGMGRHAPPRHGGSTAGRRDDPLAIPKSAPYPFRPSVTPPDGL